MKNLLGTVFAGRQHLMSGWILVVASTFTLSLAGCSLTHSGFFGPAPDQVLFEQGIEALSAAAAPEPFSRLATEYPASPWTAKAKKVEEILEKLKTEQHARSQQQKALEGCREEKARLASDVHSLEEYTARLKSLLAEAGIAEPVLPDR